MENKQNCITTATLEAFSEAFNRHDLDAIMALMTDDCVFITAFGTSAAGTRIEGQIAVRKAFGGIWEMHPNARWSNGRYWVHGDRGFSEWTYSGTARDGTVIEIDGCDLFTFRDGKIVIKDAFRKQNTAPMQGGKS